MRALKRHGYRLFHREPNWRYCRKRAVATDAAGAGGNGVETFAAAGPPGLVPVEVAEAGIPDLPVAAGAGAGGDGSVFAWSCWELSYIHESCCKGCAAADEASS